MPDTQDETYVWSAVEIDLEIEQMAILEVYITDDSFLEQISE